jgi:dienelactone hydrolase
MTVYPKAPHNFDNPRISRVPEAGKLSQTVRNCVVREEPKGVLINAMTGKPFTYADACVELGPHTGYDPEATAAARAEVTELLRTVFRLE